MCTMILRDCYGADTRPSGYGQEPMKADEARSSFEHSVAAVFDGRLCVSAPSILVRPEGAGGIVGGRLDQIRKNRT